MKLTIVHWRLRAKLASSFLVLLLLVVAQAVFAYRTIAVNRAAAAWVQHTYKVITLANEAQGDLASMRFSYRNYLLTGDEQYLAPYTAARAALSGALSSLQADTNDNPPQVTRWKSIDSEVSAWLSQVAEPDIAKERSSGGQARLGALIATDSLARSDAAFDTIDGLFSQALTVEKGLLDQRTRDATLANRELMWVLNGGVAAVAATALVLALLLSSSIGGAFGRLAIAAERLASGKLDERIRMDRDDEIGQTAAAFNTMADRLQLVVADLRDQVAQREQAEGALHQANAKLTDWVGELERRDCESSVLAESSELLQACVTLDEAYQVVASALPRLFPHHSLAVCVMNDSRNLADVVAQSGADASTKQVFEPDECWALRLGRPHRAVAAAGDVYCAHVTEPRPAISLCLPMVGQGPSLGLLHLALSASGDDDRSFPAAERMAGMLTDQVGLALANLKLRATLHTQALRDPLTGLFNRRYLEESIDREMSRAQRSRTPLGVLMLDIDHFKRLNDTYGHQTGDEVLRQVAHILMREIRHEDLACRYGGEEFILILPDASADNVWQRAEQIRRAIADLPISEERRTYGPVTVSFGVAGYPEHGGTAESLIHAADAALYRAKRAGRNRVEMAQPAIVQVPA